MPTEARREPAHRRDNSSLASRLVLLFALGSALILAGVGYAMYHALGMRLVANEDAEVTGKARAVEEILSQIDSVAALEAQIDRIRGISIGHPHLNIGLQLDGRWLIELPPKVKDTGRKFVMHQVKRTLPGTQNAVVDVTLAIETTETQELLRDHALVAAAVATVGTLASALLAWFIVRAGLAPLAELAARAEEITAQRLRARLDLRDAPREVYGLADSINRMLQRLEESFQALEEFSADIAHELRTPLNNLLLQTQVTLGRPRSADEYREALHSNLDELERMQRMVADMLFLARADRGMLEVGGQEIELGVEALMAADYFEAAAAEREQSIEVEGTATIHADRSLLRRALNNLLSNAVRYSPRGSRIGVAIQRDPQFVIVTVTNPSETIPAQELERLFKRFTRRDTSRGRDGEGSGLGLAIVDSIMKLQGGTLKAESANGIVRFSLRFPASSPA